MKTGLEKCETAPTVGLKLRSLAAIHRIKSPAIFQALTKRCLGGRFLEDKRKPLDKEEA
jgi:hypothetical protein